MSENQNEIKDRIGGYLIPRVENEYLFDELSDSYLEKAGIADILTGVPVPIKKTEMSGLSTVAIARNMAFVIGCDVNFRYKDNYISYILRTFTEEFLKPLINEGVELASHDYYESACALFRAALLMDPDNQDALYCYGRACRDAYENGDGEEYIARFKAESLEAFEKLTLKAPEFDMGFYFLGFGYVNMGLYTKARLTWQQFMELSTDKALREEIQPLLDKLVEPCKIEEGYNCVLSGRFEEGIAILSDYEEDSRFNNWWPLWHYLGSAYKGLEMPEEAEKRFLQVLKCAPSNADAMRELVEIYRARGDEEKAEKYEKKIRIVEENAQKDREERREAQMPGLS
jgi:tetratricopeptide (TPR) repeat protein